MANANGKGKAIGETILQAAVTALATVFGAGFVPTIEVKRLSISQRPDHRTPNLAAVLLAVRSVLNISQTELGTNRRKNGEPLFGSVDAYVGSPNGSGWFSVIANVEQGGRRTPIPAAFGLYLAQAFGIDVETLTLLIDADNAIMAGFATVNRNANRTHANLSVCQRCSGPLTSETAAVESSPNGSLFLVHKGECPTETA